MVRAGSSNNLIPSWNQKEVASIEWAELGNLKSYLKRENLNTKSTLK